MSMKKATMEAARVSTSGKDNKKNDMPKPFLFYFDWLETFRQCPDDMKLEYIEAVLNFGFFGEEPSNQIMKALTASAIGTIKRDKNRYEETCARNRENGLKGGAPAGNNNACKHRDGKTTKNNQNNPLGYKTTQNNIDTDTDTDIDTDIDTELIEEKYKEKRTSGAADTFDFFGYFESLFKLPERLLKDWKRVRKDTRAVNTETAAKTIENELRKAMARGHSAEDCISSVVANSWRGFKAEWMDREPKTANERKGCNLDNTIGNEFKLIL